MASLKALCLAGVASLAVMGMVHAADLLPPPPQVVFQPPVSPIALDGAFYLRGDVGVGINDLRTRPSTFDYAVPDVRYENTSITDSPIIDIGVGYRFNNYFRADVTGEYRGTAEFHANESYNSGAFAVDQYGNSAPNNGRSYDNYSAHIRTVVGLLNGYVDVGTWYGVTPFVGAGVGVANIQVKGLTDISYGGYNGFGDGGGGFAGSRSQTNFAFAFMAGLDFAVTPNVSLELGYRYLNMGNVSTGAITCASAPSCPNEVQHYKLQANDIRLGFRYTFANLAPPPLPLIRKY